MEDLTLKLPSYTSTLETSYMTWLKREFPKERKRKHLKLQWMLHWNSEHLGNLRKLINNAEMMLNNNIMYFNINLSIIFYPQET